MIIFCACENKEKVEGPILSEEVMVETLALIYFNEVKAINQFDLGVQKNEYLKKYLYPAIFDSLNLNENSFYQSYDYYDNHPSAMKDLMDKVTISMQTFKTDTFIVKEDGRSLQEAYEQIEQMEEIIKKKKRKTVK